jgi:hypothetical protein
MKGSDVLTFLLYPLLTTMLYYLGARAMITQWLWSRYPARVDHFMMCAACSGVWYGAAVTAIHGYGLNGWSPTIGGVIAVALASGVWTPLLAALHHKALLYLGGDAATGSSSVSMFDEHGNNIL